jgi:TPR repeat protein
LDAEDLASLHTNIEDARAGNSHASFWLGVLFTTGTAVKRDDKEAFRWFLLAARQGHPNAYVQLGHRYHRGLGVAQNDKAAAYWFFVGASNGDNNATAALGGLHAAGHGVQQNWTTAVSLWEKAGNWRFVGDAYACGLGVEQDNERALSLYRKAAAAEDMSGTIQLGHMHAFKCAAAPDDGAAFEAYKTAADRGYPEAQLGLSLLYLEGRGVVPSGYQAYFWARLAELRLPPGELRTLASTRAGAATRFMAAGEIEDAEKFAKSIVASGTQPMNK